ncbi:hypothetical protein FJZ31_25000 [Candidatus Poribacteria bacterium]|nr:hypothetical protein [Candidatus Poribacteria bacterium]
MAFYSCYFMKNLCVNHIAEDMKRSLIIALLILFRLQFPLALADSSPRILQNPNTEKSWEPSTFDHQKSKYPLNGEHANFACGECHPGGKYPSLETTCFLCHETDAPHRGQLSRNCASCHTNDNWKPSTYLHAERMIQRVKKSHWRPLIAWLLPESITPKDKIITYKYELIGKHADLKCQQCHKDNRYEVTNPDCISCHAKNDQHVGLPGRDCQRCHTPKGWDVISFDHRLSAFPLQGEHARLPCTSCHQSNQYKGTSRRCQHCHADSVSHANDINSDCETCHTSEFSWQVVTFNHNQSSFPLRYKHQSVKCWDCHREDSFEGLSKECFTCHEDTHKGEFGSKCEICHSEMAWKPTNFKHVLTGFPLTGKHIAADCTDCHPNGRYQGTSQNCYSCHQQDTPDAHYGIRCDDCHTASSWKDMQFKHTTFPINSGPHGNLECADCHPVKDFYQEFTCISGGCHPKNNIDQKHREENGYVYDSIACFKCHPTGRGEEEDDD